MAGCPRAKTIYCVGHVPAYTPHQGDAMVHEGEHRRSQGLRTLPLHEEHIRLGARMFAFGDRLMPLSYSSIIKEHLQVRRRAGLFDVSHMGRFALHGSAALETISGLVATDLAALPVGRAQYTVLLTPEGGIRDDLIVYREEQRVLLVVNAANTEADAAWIAEHLPENASLENLSEETGLLALQGPDALGVLSQVFGRDVAGMKPFTHARADLGSTECIIARTGYTGEPGAEVMMPAEAVSSVWSALLEAGAPGTVLPCGLGARDTLRLEAGLLLYGNDMDTTTTPFEAGLEWLVSLDRPGFVGREALLQAKAKGPRRVLLGLTTEARGIPRHGDRLKRDGESVGRVTSGSFSPVLGHPIALAYLVPEAGVVGQRVEVEVRGRLLVGRLVEPRFYRRGVTPLPPEKGERQDDSAPTGDGGRA